MRARLGLSMAGLLVGLSAFGCGDDDAPEAGDQPSRAAEALARAMHFTGGELRDGAMELASENRVEVILASEQVMRPGRAGIMPLEVDDPIEDEKPPTAALMQFGEVEQHVRVPTKNSVAGEGDLNFEFELDDDACEGLCAQLIDVPVTVALELKGGDISKHLKTQIALDCRNDGDPDACDDQGGSDRDGGTSTAGKGGSSGGRDGSVSVDPVATAAVEGLLDAVEDYQTEVCSCLGGSQGDTCLTTVLDARSCDEAVLLAFAEGNEDLIACTQAFFEEQYMCASAAACDAEMLASCSPASAAEDNNWVAIEAKCGTVPVGIRTGIDGCEGQSQTMLPCGDGTSYPIDARCDDYEDCSDGSDELGCGMLPGDPGGRPTSFPCSNGAVLDFADVCDGANDCPDGLDEMVCVACPDGSGQFSPFDQCDGEPDCADGADEAGCMFPCQSGEMVMIQRVCDGTRDCSDGSDESFCMSGMFTCTDGGSIPIAKACDGTEDCADGSDESSGLCGG